eukprot:9336653-Pyramimonas_sp.AAC.1
MYWMLVGVFGKASRKPLGGSFGLSRSFSEFSGFSGASWRAPRASWGPLGSLLAVSSGRSWTESSND